MQKDPKTHRCPCCGNEYSLEKGYYKSSSELFMGTGRLPICISCVNDLYDIYLQRYKRPQNTIKRMCMLFDMYYDESIIDSCIKDNCVMGEYIKKMNLSQNRKKSFDTSLREGFSFRMTVGTERDVFVVDDETVHPEDIERWGGGLDIADYRTLNSHYNFLKEANPNCDSNQEIFIVDLCYIKMQQMKAIREGKTDDYSKMAEQYRKSFSQAGLKTTRDANEAESFAVGVNIETIEKYTPAEYYKNKSLYKDHDNIGDYMERFCLRPLRNLMHGTTDRDHEFFVKDEEDVNEFADE